MNWPKPHLPNLISMLLALALIASPVAPFQALAASRCADYSAESAPQAELPPVTGPLVFRWAKMGGRFVKGRWKNYRQEVREQGKVRILLAPRENPTKFNWLVSLIDPFFDLPVEVYSLIKTKAFKKKPVMRRLSIPVAITAGVILFGSIGVGMQMKAYQQSLTYLEQSVKSDAIGARHVSEMMRLEHVSPIDAAKIINSYDSAIAKWSQSKADFPRMKLFVEKGIVKGEAEKTHLDQVLKTTAFKASIVDKDRSAKNLKTQLSIAVEKSPILSAKPEWMKQTILLSFLPEVPYQEGTVLDTYMTILQASFGDIDPSDVNQLILKGVGELGNFQGEEIGIPYQLNVLERSKANTSLILAKIDRAKEMGFPADKLHVAARIDIPLFSGEIEYYDLAMGKLQLKSELDRWELLLNDWRFATVAEAWKKGQISSIQALGKMSQMMGALHNLFQIQLAKAHQVGIEKLNIENIPPPSFGEIVRLMDGTNGSPGNHLFSGVPQILKSVKDKIPLKDLNALKYSLGRLYWDYYAKDAFLIGHNQVREQALQQVRSLEETFIRGALGGQFYHRISDHLPADFPH